MGATRRRFTLEYRIEAAHRVIDSNRSVAEVAKELSLVPDTLGRWVREERRRMSASGDKLLKPNRAGRASQAGKEGCRAGERPRISGKSSGVLRSKSTKAERYALMGQSPGTWWESERDPRCAQLVISS